MEMPYEKSHSSLERPLLDSLTINWEIVAYLVIIVLAFASRLYILDARVMSHDENSHVYYSWLFYRGNGYQHDPITHGPFQFHIVALTYFLFGDNDFTARIPAALFGVMAIGFMWFFRRYLGRAGALVAAVLLLISPYILFYDRYVRNESFVVFWCVTSFWLILRYIEKGSPKYLYLLAAVTALNFATKETAFINSAQALLFLAFYFIARLTKKPWPQVKDRSYFLLSMIAGLVFLGGAGIFMVLSRKGVTPNPSETVSPAVPGQGLTPLTSETPNTLLAILAILGLLFILAALFFLFRGFTLKNLRKERSFSLLVLYGTLALPLLAAFPLKILNWKIPVNASQVISMTTGDILHIAAVVIPLAILSVVIGLLWNPRQWLIIAGVYYIIFTVLYTSVFTNGAGFFTGLVGSLGYWLEQQGVNRGSQPWYYYWLIQIPTYEFLPALGSFLALGIAITRWMRGKSLSTVHPVNGLLIRRGEDLSDQEPAGVVSVMPTDTENEEKYPFAHNESDRSELEVDESQHENPPTVELLGFWVVTSLIAYSIAGEKMPWLTVHITLPMILLSGWAIGYVIDRVDWQLFLERRGWLILLLLPVALVSTLSAIFSILGIQPPFQGKDLESLKATSTFVLSLLVSIGSIWALLILVKPWPTGQFNRVILLFFFGFLGLLTMRTAFRASYINYDNATEFLVYAHSSGGVKDALRQIEEISRRTAGYQSAIVAYDDQTTYPYWWYLRNYPNQRYYGANPTRSLRDAPLILVGDTNYGKIEPIVGNAYDKFDYIRLWWPNQDYFGLTPQRIFNALMNPKMRSALFQIWFNRDYSEYGTLTNKDMSLQNWYPSARMRLYVRKDIISQLWNYGSVQAPEQAVADPCENKQIKLSADVVIGGPGTGNGQFQKPRGIAVAPDGSLYVADTGNQRIVHLARDGGVINSWGTFADVSKGEAPGGTFNEPWGIAVAPDGSVYVADTWNHRVQKFSSDGKFITMWGYFGQAEQPDGFWGPRDVAVDTKGRVFVTDTGNKRIVVFNPDGNYLYQFGEAGFSPGQFDEPVGVAVDTGGKVYVADTWNQRIQTFNEETEGNFLPAKSWDVAAWYGQSLDNKPYLAVDSKNRVFATDPEGYRVLEFSDQGACLAWWGDYGTGPDGIGMAGAVAIDAQDGVWLTDAGNSRLMHFVLPGP